MPANHCGRHVDNELEGKSMAYQKASSPVNTGQNPFMPLPFPLPPLPPFPCNPFPFPPFPHASFPPFPSGSLPPLPFPPLPPFAARPSSESTSESIAHSKLPTFGSAPLRSPFPFPFPFPVPFPLPFPPWPIWEVFGLTSAFGAYSSPKEQKGHWKILTTPPLELHRQSVVCAHPRNITCTL